MPTYDDLTGLCVKIIINNCANINDDERYIISPIDSADDLPYYRKFTLKEINANFKNPR